MRYKEKKVMIKKKVKFNLNSMIIMMNNMFKNNKKMKIII